MWVKGDTGGNWSNGVNAGSRCVNANNYPWNVNTNIGSRLACECIGLTEMMSLYGASPVTYTVRPLIPAARQKLERLCAVSTDSSP